MGKGPPTGSPILPTYCLFLLITRRAQLASRLYEDGQEGKAFWQERFYDFNVYRSGKVKEKLNYMHANPVIRGLAPHPKDWPWSSWSFYFQDQ